MKRLVSSFRVAPNLERSRYCARDPMANYGRLAAQVVKFAGSGGFVDAFAMNEITHIWRSGVNSDGLSPGVAEFGEIAP